MTPKRTIEIEDCSDLPENRKTKYPFNRLTEQGKGFFVPSVKQTRLTPTVAYWNKKLAPAHFRTQVGERDGKRGVWVIRDA